MEKKFSIMLSSVFKVKNQTCVLVIIHGPGEAEALKLLHAPVAAFAAVAALDCFIQRHATACDSADSKRGAHTQQQTNPKGPARAAQGGRGTPEEDPGGPRVGHCGPGDAQAGAFETCRAQGVPRGLAMPSDAAAIFEAPCSCECPRVGGAGKMWPSP